MPHFISMFQYMQYYERAIFIAVKKRNWKLAEKMIIEYESLMPKRKKGIKRKSTSHNLDKGNAK